MCKELKKYFAMLFFPIAILLFFSGCGTADVSQKQQTGQDTLEILKRSPSLPNLFSDSFSLRYTIKKDTLDNFFPAIQSFAAGEHNGLWIFIGGEKNGFHGRVSNPVPFPSNQANDSIWVIDFLNRKSWSAAVPPAWSILLSATNACYCQVGDSLYYCGGYTKRSGTDRNFNFTSDHFLEINLGNLVQYVQSGGRGISFNQVITKTIRDSFAQVTGGSLVYANGFFSLIGGQNYQDIYAAGVTGDYTNAIRVFSLKKLSSGQWSIVKKNIFTDSANLHRRDMNLVYLSGNNHPEAILYGGVFTGKNEAFRNTVFIDGLSTGNPVIQVDTMNQNANQYSCANITFSGNEHGPVLTSFFGGISYVRYDQISGQLRIGDNGISMPWSNLVSSMITNHGNSASKEIIQIPPEGQLLPAYMGANAAFIPIEKYRVAGCAQVLDLARVIKDAKESETLVGFIYGGIISLGPTSGTNENGFVPTFSNPDLYQVYLRFQ
jgi:hypothetical protein